MGRDERRGGVRETGRERREETEAVSVFDMTTNLTFLTPKIKYSLEIGDYIIAMD